MIYDIIIRFSIILFVLYIYIFYSRYIQVASLSRHFTTPKGLNVSLMQAFSNHCFNLSLRGPTLSTMKAPLRSLTKTVTSTPAASQKRIPKNGEANFAQLGKYARATMKTVLFGLHNSCWEDPVEQHTGSSEWKSNKSLKGTKRAYTGPLPFDHTVALDHTVETLEHQPYIKHIYCRTL